MKRTFLFALGCLSVMPYVSLAQTSSYNQVVGADTFVSSGQPNQNFGAMGAMEIAVPTAAQPRTEMTLMAFDTSAMQAAFNGQYGAGDWAVAGVALQLFSNVPLAGLQPNNGSFNRIAAGGFEFDLLGNNNWDESSITWNTLPAILPGSGNNNTLTSLGTFNWDAAAETSSVWTLNPNQSLSAAIEAGGEVSILGQPTSGSTVGYLFNTLTSNPGYLEVTVQAAPEPSTVGLLIGSLCIVRGSRIYRSKIQVGRA